MEAGKIRKPKVILLLILLFEGILISNSTYAQNIGSVTCFNDKERAGGEIYPYNQSLFLSNASEEEWWDNIVEEIYYSGIDFSALLCRGYSPGRPSIDAGDPRKIPNMIAAMDRRKLGNDFTLAIFDDCPAGWTANHNYDQGRGYNTNTLFDCSDINNYKYIWDYNLKISIENIPDSRRFKVDGRMVIFFWSVKPRWMTNIDHGNLKRILQYIRIECQKEFGFNPYLIVQDCWFDNDSHLKPSDVDAIHNWFSASNGRNWSLHNVNNRKIGVVAPGFGYEGDPNHPFINPNHGQTLINGLEGTVNSGAFITLCEGFTDAAETAAYWRSKDTTYYDYPNQRLNILRRYSQKAFATKRIVQAEACDFYYDRTSGNKGESFREGDLDICKTSDVYGGWNVFDAEAGEWLEWKELPISEMAHFEIRYAAEQASQIQLVIGDQKGPILSLAPTGGSQNWATVVDTSFTILQKGYNNFRINVISGTLSLNYFMIISEGSTGFVNINTPASGARYLQTDTIKVNAKVTGIADSLQRLELYVDSVLIGYSRYSAMDTMLTGLSVGEHFIKLKAINKDGNYSIDSSKIFIGSTQYKITSNTLGKGTIIFDPPGATYVEGTKVSVTARPEYRSFFDGWTGDVTSNENPLILTLESDIEVVASFLDLSDRIIKVNFQPDSTPVPEGYLKDTGLEFGARGNGYSYGWVGNPNNATRDRGTPGDSRYATLNHMQIGKNQTWEIEVENSTYLVYLVMGDPSFSNQTNTVNVEGVVKVDQNITTNFDEYYLVAEVTDNRLTISPANGADNAKICFVEITQEKTNNIGTYDTKTHNFELNQNYPNPFHHETHISFNLQKAGHTRIIIYNVFGQIITTLIEEELPSGTHQLTFNAANLPSGLYFYRMQFDNFSMVRKMLLAK